MFVVGAEEPLLLARFCHMRKDFAYCEGQHNDARMNLAIALTATKQGACIANHTEVIKLLKKVDEHTGKERVCGATVRDNMSGEPGDVTD